MQDSPLDPLLSRIGAHVRLYQRGPRQGITEVELINAVFSHLGQFERYDLVDEVARLIPDSAHQELRRVIEIILQPGADYVPFMFGRPADLAAWRQRMIPACQRLAALFRQWLDTAPGVGP
jgi:hypothetical protein